MVQCSTADMANIHTRARARARVSCTNGGAAALPTLPAAVSVRTHVLNHTVRRAPCRECARRGTEDDETM